MAINITHEQGTTTVKEGWIRRWRTLEDMVGDVGQGTIAWTYTSVGALREWVRLNEMMDEMNTDVILSKSKLDEIVLYMNPKRDDWKAYTDCRGIDSLYRNVIMCKTIVDHNVLDPDTDLARLGEMYERQFRWKRRKDKYFRLISHVSIVTDYRHKYNRPLEFLAYPEPVRALVTISQSITDIEPELEWLFYGAMCRGALNAQREGSTAMYWDHVPWRELYERVTEKISQGNNSKSNIALFELESLAINPERRTPSAAANEQLKLYIQRRKNKRRRLRDKKERRETYERRKCCNHCGERCMKCCWCGKYL